MEMRKAFFAHRSLWWNPKRSTAGEIFWLMDQKGFPIRWHFERIPIINLTHVSACGLNMYMYNMCMQSQLSCSCRDTAATQNKQSARDAIFSPRVKCVYENVHLRPPHNAILCNVPFIFLPRQWIAFRAARRRSSYWLTSTKLVYLLACLFICLLQNSHAPDRFSIGV